MRSFWFKSVAVLAAVCAVSCSVTAQRAFGQQDKPSPVLHADVQRANDRAEERFRQAVSTWRYRLSMLRNRDRLKSFARDIASAEEKWAQGTDLFSSSGQRTDRMLEAFRRRFGDERKLIEEMKEAFADLQAELLKESRELYIRAGVSRKLVDRVLPNFYVDATPWEGAFRPLLGEARSMAQEDWWRMATVAAGGMVAASAQKSRTDSENQSWGSLLTSLVTELVADAIVNEAMDPTDKFASRLSVTFLDAENVLLEGETGLLPAMQLLTVFHQQSRLTHLVPAVEGGE